MKKFKFRLERVLEYRNALKKEKERELALKNAQLARAEQVVEEITEAQNNAAVPGGGLTTMAELMLHGDYHQFLQDALVNQRLLVLEAAHAVEQARDAYLEKAIEAETLENLKRKRAEEHREQARKEERKEADKLTVQRFRFGQRRDGNES